MKNISLTNKFIVGLVAGFALLGALIVANPGQANAAYNGGRIIDNGVLLNSNSMNASQIQSFLASKGSGLASRNFVLQCYGANSKERQWYTAVGAPCDQSIPASHIIFYAARIYGINPQVILATMQKEQSLVTAANPTSWQINQAMGYGCPTTGNCSGNSTFSYQIDSGTWVLRYHYERANGNNSWWSPSTSWVCGTEKNFYKPNLYPGQNVRFYDGNGTLYRTYFIHNAATSSFYCYTPHAYNNPQGLFGRPAYGTTGQYYSGSYNFVTAFETWFGSTQNIGASHVVNKYSAMGGSGSWLGAATSGVQSAGRGGLYQVFQDGKIYWHPNTGAWTVRFGDIDNRYAAAGYEGRYLGYPRSDEITIPGKGVYQQFEGGSMYWSSSTGAWDIRYGSMFTRFMNLGYESGYLGFPTTGEVRAASGVYQQFQGGRLYWRPNSPAMDMNNAVHSGYSIAGSENGYLGLPKQSMRCGIANGGCWMLFDGGKVYWSAPTGAFDVRFGDMDKKYAELSYEGGVLGYPISREIQTGQSCGGYNNVRQNYQYGTITWSKCSNPTTTVSVD